MAFRELEKGISERFRSLKGDMDHSRLVIGVIRSLYPKRTQKSLIQEVEFQKKTRTLKLFPATKAVATRFIQDRDLIRASLRREGLDIKRILVKDV